MSDENRETGGKAGLSAEWIEWVVAAFASMLVLGLVAYLVTIAVTHRSGEPELVLSVKTIEEARPGYVVVSLRNEGDASAAGVQIEGVLPDGEAGEATLDYSPADSETTATLVFSRPVEPGELTLRVKGYADP
jgi:uncharacterized protein (TIGR02588 family)